MNIFTCFLGEGRAGEVKKYNTIQYDITYYSTIHYNIIDWFDSKGSRIR